MLSPLVCFQYADTLLLAAKYAKGMPLHYDANCPRLKGVFYVFVSVPQYLSTEQICANLFMKSVNKYTKHIILINLRWRGEGCLFGTGEVGLVGSVPGGGGSHCQGDGFAH